MNTMEQIQQAAAGNTEAMLSLRNDFLPLLHKAASQPHLRAMGADALAEAELSFLLAVKSYDPARKIPFPGYAKSMVYNSLRTLFKQERRRWQREIYPSEPVDGLGFWEQLPDGQPTPDQQLDTAELHQLLSRLSLRQQQLLWLLYGEDYTQKAAAKRLGITQQAAAALKKRSLITLRKSLHQQDK